MTTTTTLRKALALAERGFSVFPCSQHKTPVISKADGGRGFHDASTDPATIERMFNRRNAVLIGVPTGAVVGFDVLDWDPKNGGAESMVHIRPRLPETREHRTRSGGGHLLFQHHPGIRNTQGKDGGIAPGIDTRGCGGYVIWWPAFGCEVINGADPAPWPSWLLEKLIHKPEPAPTETGWRQRIADDSTFARRLLQRQLQRVAEARPGERHHTLRAASKTVGGILSEVGITSSGAAEELFAAVKHAGGHDVVDGNAKATIAYGLEWGAARPLTAGGARG